MKKTVWLIACTIGCGASASPESTVSSSPVPSEVESTETAQTTEDVATDITMTWTIAAERVDCVGVGPQRCMRVREGDGEWTLFYDNIEGLEAVEGTEYSVVVRQEEVENPPADGSSTRTILVEVLSQNEVAQPTTCSSSSDCPDGQQCTGDEGCDVAWTCQPPRPCTRDLRPYCTCDGRTVRGSGSCPPEPFRSRGACAP